MQSILANRPHIDAEFVCHRLEFEQPPDNIITPHIVCVLHLTVYRGHQGVGYFEFLVDFAGRNFSTRLELDSLEDLPPDGEWMSEFLP